MANLKPWKSITEQLALLEKRGLLVDNQAAALNYLMRIGYYRLSGYWYPLRKIDKEASSQQKRPIRTDYFAPNSHFEDVVKLGSMLNRVGNQISTYRIKSKSC